jgi:hypothetical protein
MKITPYCSVCLVPICLTLEGKITNPHSDNPKLTDETIVKNVISNIQKIFPTNAERDKNAIDTMYSKIIDKENYVLALDTQKISNKKECLYFWDSTPTENIVACAVDPNLQSVLLTPFMNKKNTWKHVLVNTKKSNSWDENVESLDHYFDRLYEIIEEELTFTIKANGKKKDYDGVYEIQIKGDIVESILEIDEKKRLQKEDYISEKTIERTMSGPEYEILYNHNQTVDDACCVVSIQMNKLLSAAMILVVY